MGRAEGGEKEGRGGAYKGSETCDYVLFEKANRKITSNRPDRSISLYKKDFID